MIRLPVQALGFELDYLCRIVWVRNLQRPRAADTEPSGWKGLNQWDPIEWRQLFETVINVRSSGGVCGVGAIRVVHLAEVSGIRPRVHRDRPEVAAPLPMPWRPYRPGETKRPREVLPSWTKPNAGASKMKSHACSLRKDCTSTRPSHPD